MGRRRCIRLGFLMLFFILRQFDNRRLDLVQFVRIDNVTRRSSIGVLRIEATVAASICLSVLVNN